MCLYPQLIRNKKYTATKKNDGVIPVVHDQRVLAIPIGCGNCIECRKQKKREWQIRLTEEVSEKRNGNFITLTFSNESIKQLCEQEKLQNLKGYTLDNAIATTAMRLFRERWRKRFKKAPRRWFVTELGHNGTENIHLHGILWTDEQYGTIANIWQYGYIWPKPSSTIKTYVNERTVNYLIKYISKQDLDHPNYKSRILCSPGIGANYLNKYQSQLNKYNGNKTNEAYRLPTGHKSSLPIYYRNKIYSDEEREKLWLQRLDKDERWVCGEHIKEYSKNKDDYYNLIRWHRIRNKELGYGTSDKDWDKIQYETEQRILLYNKRIEATNQF